jgi:hypothetical protein
LHGPDLVDVEWYIFVARGKVNARLFHDVPDCKFIQYGGIPMGQVGSGQIGFKNSIDNLCVDHPELIGVIGPHNCLESRGVARL